MDFYTIKTRTTRNKTIEVYPDFQVVRSSDLMVRAKSFYAIWDEEKGLWSTDEYDVQRLVDRDLYAFAKKLHEETGEKVYPQLMRDFESRSWAQFRSYVNNLSDSSRELDSDLTFSNTEVRKGDYVSRRLPYPLDHGETPAYDELLSTLYDPQERAKLEWALGAIIAGEAKSIQKFIVLFGAPGSGKSTFLTIVKRLFEGYYATFDAKALVGSNNAFATEAFKSNPLVAIQDDGDLSRIEDNTKLNSIASHEEIIVNEKNKPTYSLTIKSFLFMGTNKPVKITDAQSGIIRRLIDVTPTGNRIPTRRYFELMSQIDFELSAIAAHCLDVFREMGKNYYSDYAPIGMMFKTDIIYNFVEDSFFVFKDQEFVTLKQAYSMYKEYCSDTGIPNVLPQYRFREELRPYFDEYHERKRHNEERLRSVYIGFRTGKFELGAPVIEEAPSSLVLDHSESLIDELYSDQPAQYATASEIPQKRWAEVTTVLSDIDTSQLHYVKLPENHIVIDFDLRNDDGEKDPIRNLEAASLWPPTYSEYSKGGGGVHLHYIYDGDATRLSRIYSEGIEVKVFTGDSSLRRRVTRCNRVPVAVISSGLPIKEEKPVLDIDQVMSEKGLRALILRNLNKEIHDSTKPSIDFIHKILEDAYSSDLKYDVSDLRAKILAFATSSTNQALLCIKIVNDMKFKSAEESVELYSTDNGPPIAFYDVEVFPNLFVVCYKFKGAPNVASLINPAPSVIEEMAKFRLVGFNNRKYDNHILYAAMMGYDTGQLYKLSQRIIDNDRDATFGEAYRLSYADIYDFSSKKQGLKKFQIELGLHHKELGLPWDEDVSEELWGAVAEYCANDVITTEQVFDDRIEDFHAREILAEISGLSVNDTTQKHTARIIFGTDKNASEKFVYTDLSEMFPGYVYDFGVSTYRGETVGEGGYVYAEPGMYTNTALIDVASMHPTSLVNLNAFGPYTQNFKDLMDARLAIKGINTAIYNSDLATAEKLREKASGMLGGKLKPYLTEGANLEALSFALKIVINIVYGLTSAKFPNPFLDIRNKDNIVAKRGALFMIDLKHALQERGCKVAHIKTDSVKIPDATPEDIEFVMDFGRKYGYEFEHEKTYEKLCLVNDAVFIGKTEGKWSAVGKQYQHPYVFKTLFTKETVDFDDLAELKTVTTALYLDDNEGLGPDEHNYRFVGRVGSFVPVIPGVGGGELLRKKDDKYAAATGSKGYRWMETETVRALDMAHAIDFGYYKKLTDAAVDNLSKYGDVEWFIG